MRYRFIVSGAFLFSSLLASSVFAQEEQPQAFEFFPDARLFPRIDADGTAQQFSLSKDMLSRRWIGSIGGSRYIVQWNPGTLEIQAGVAATVYASLIGRPSILEVMTVDFFVDFPVEIRLDDHFALRTGWGHHSGHLADDAIEVAGLTAINYARDYVTFCGSYTAGDAGGFLYAGGRLYYYSIPEKGPQYLAELGGETPEIRLSPLLGLYAAVDIKLKSEVAWATTQSYQCGVRILQRSASALRFAYTYRTGIDDRGQFYNQRTTTSSLGIYIDF
jgi:hypothetical protein